MPVSGEAVAELAAFDAAMQETMAAFALPGGQCAIAREGRLVFNRGYGYADIETGEPGSPDALFRIASTSKPVTAVAVLTLIDAGMLTLDEPVFPLLNLEPARNAVVDPRIATITVEQLLVHSGGWDSTATFDPQYLPWSRMAAATLGKPDPAEGETIIQYMLGVPLDFDPGTRSVYSNFGYNVLGRVIERVSGQRYEEYCLEHVLHPAGITDMRIGGTRLSERFPGEVRYYGPPDQPMRESVFPGEGYVPVGYGSYYMAALDAHGGWIASAADLVRFALAVDGARGQAILSPDAVQVMEYTPRPATGDTGAGNEAGGHGLGWNVALSDDGAEWSHAGALEGSNCSWLVRMPDGTVLAVVFNSLPADFAAFFGALLPKLRETLASVTAWPEHDLFG
jgi:N-acyl-D-amino-acid deacylase